MSNRSTYVELHGDVYTNRKTIAAAKKLTRGDVDKMVGHLGRLWNWVLERNDDGNLEHLPDQMVASAANWKGRPKRFVAALIQAGFIDQDRRIHDWNLYGGRVAIRREVDRERKRIEREVAEKLALEEAKRAETLMLSDGHPADVLGMSLRSQAELSQAEPKEPASSSLRSEREGVSVEERLVVALAKIGCTGEQIGQFKLDYLNDLAVEVIVEKIETLARTTTRPGADPVLRVKHYLKPCEDSLEEERARVRQQREADRRSNLSVDEQLRERYGDAFMDEREHK